VLVRSHAAAALTVLIVAWSLGGCVDDTTRWFPKPVNLFGNGAGYTYSSLGDARQNRPIPPNDLVDANGACPNYAAPAPEPAPPPQPPAAGAAADSLPPAPDTAILGGVALGMSECAVVSRLGQPTAVNLGRNPNGLRSAILTYKSGPRPGIYRFEAGALSEMDRVELPPAPPEKKTAKAKKKRAPTNAPPAGGSS